MASYLIFESAAPVCATALEGILAAASELCATQPWIYCEPMLPKIEDDGCLRGWSKLNLQPWPEDVEAAAAAEQHDLIALLNAAAQWSRDYEVEWIVKLDDGELGRIRAGVCDPAVQDSIESLMALSASGQTGSVLMRLKGNGKNQLRLFDPHSN